MDLWLRIFAFVAVPGLAALIVWTNHAWRETWGDGLDDIRLLPFDPADPPRDEPEETPQ